MRKRAAIDARCGSRYSRFANFRKSSPCARTSDFVFIIITRTASLSHFSLDSAQLDWLGPDPWAEHEISGGNESEESSIEDGALVTGNTETPLEIEGDPESLPGCVILNNVGSLLARKRNKGIPSSNGRYFLEKMVATIPGKSVPLVYPEAMLFPSLFWKDDGTEGSLLGAIPCGALAHPDTLRKFGIADLTSIR